MLESAVDAAKSDSDNRTESDPSGLGTDELRKEIELPAWGDSEM